MEMKRKAQASMNLFQCPTKRCEGTAFVPISLTELARIRTFGETKKDTKFSCGHYHSIALT